MSEVIEPVSLEEAINVLSYFGPLFPLENNGEWRFTPQKSVELVPNGLSENFQFYLFMRKGFLVHSSPAFQNPFFRVKYFHYGQGKYQP